MGFKTRSRRPEISGRRSEVSELQVELLRITYKGQLITFYIRLTAYCLPMVFTGYQKLCPWGVAKYSLGASSPVVRRRGPDFLFYFGFMFFVCLATSLVTQAARSFDIR